MKKTILWRGITALMAFLYAFVYFGSACALSYESKINSFLGVSATTVVNDDNETICNDFPSAYGEYTDENLAALEKDVYDHIVREEEEGAVLLMNNNGALPLNAGSKISLLGLASRYPLYHTSSAGSRTYKNDEQTIDLYEALTVQGFEINDMLYHAYDSQLPRTGEGGFPPWGDGTKNYLGTGNCEAPVSIYTEEVVSTFAQYGDAAIVIISREGGEGRDMAVSEVDAITGEVISSLALHQNEKDMLKLASEHFEKIIVIINTTYFVELDWMEEYGVDACLWIGSPGNTGMTGVAEILSGEVNPSGRLSDTFAASSLSAPAMANSCENAPEWANLDTLYTDGIVVDTSTTRVDVELENIYIGYKYYETRYADCIMGTGNAASDAGCFRSEGAWNYADEMCFPFGWGLSYTTFSQKITNVAFDEGTDQYKVTVEVTNTGDEAGKMAVLVYAQTPYGEYEKTNSVEKSAIQFVGYEKTGAVEAGKTVSVTVPVDRYLLASYDQNKAKGYILSAGDTYLSVGESSHDALNNILAVQGYTGMFNPDGSEDTTLNTDCVYKITDGSVPASGDPDAATYSHSAATGEPVTNRFDLQDINYWSKDTGVTVTYLTRSDWTTFPETVSVPCLGVEMQTLLQGEVYGKAEDAISASSINQGVPAGYTFLMMKDVDYDDDVTWDTFLDQFTVEELASLFPNMQGTPAVDSVSMPATHSADGCNGSDAAFGAGLGAYSPFMGGTQNSNFGYGGNFASVIAATWNKELQEERGYLMAQEDLFQGCNEAWTGGLDLRRTPFGGRNEEYPSEDANVNYYFGMIELSAMQACGVIAGPKHFCGNDFETARNGISYFYREQAFREGSLRGFEGAMRSDLGGVLGAMGIYGRQGLTYSPACSALNDVVVRGEWGFRGHLITDAAVNDYASHFVDQLMGGTDMICFDFDGISAPAIIDYIKSTDDGNALLKLRGVVKNTVYTFTQSAAVNGLSASSHVVTVTPAWVNTLHTVQIVTAILLALSIVLYVTSALIGRKEKRNEK